MATNWNVSSAVENWFANPPKTQSAAKIDKAKATSVFYKYSQGRDSMEFEEAEKFFTEIGATDAMEQFMISYHMQAEHYYEVRLTEFLKASESLGVDSIDAWRHSLSKIRQQLQQPDQFKKMYKYLFTYAQDGGDNKKNVSIETSCQYWECLLTHKNPYFRSTAC
jgi:DCN1-like protein 1/2